MQGEFGPVAPAIPCKQEKNQGSAPLSASLPDHVRPKCNIMSYCPSLSERNPLSCSSTEQAARSNVTMTRDKVAALKFLRKPLKRHGQTEDIVTALSD
jgi:hypothetical protein